MPMAKFASMLLGPSLCAWPYSEPRSVGSHEVQTDIARDKHAMIAGAYPPEDLPNTYSIIHHRRPPPQNANTWSHYLRSRTSL